MWIEKAARVEKSTAIVWAATARAAHRLGLTNWQVMLFSDEELPCVDTALPGFLPQKEREVPLLGPEVVDAAGASVDERKSA